MSKKKKKKDRGLKKFIPSVKDMIAMKEELVGYYDRCHLSEDSIQLREMIRHNPKYRGFTEPEMERIFGAYPETFSDNVKSGLVENSQVLLLVCTILAPFGAIYLLIMLLKGLLFGTGLLMMLIWLAGFCLLFGMIKPNCRSLAKTLRAADSMGRSAVESEYKAVIARKQARAERAARVAAEREQRRREEEEAAAAEQPETAQQVMFNRS